MPRAIVPPQPRFQTPICPAGCVASSKLLSRLDPLGLCDGRSWACLPPPPRGAGGPPGSSLSGLLAVAVGASSSSQAPHPRQQAACGPAEDAVTGRAYGGHMPRRNTAAHGRGRRSSRREGAEPCRCPRRAAPAWPSWRPLCPGSALEGEPLLPWALGVLWVGGPPGEIGRCVLCPLDVALLCKILQNHSLISAGRGGVSRGGGLVPLGHPHGPFADLEEECESATWQRRAGRRVSRRGPSVYKGQKVGRGQIPVGWVEGDREGASGAGAGPSHCPPARPRLNRAFLAIFAIPPEGGTVLVPGDLAPRKAGSLACCLTARKWWSQHRALSRGSVRGGGQGLALGTVEPSAALRTHLLSPWSLAGHLLCSPRPRCPTALSSCLPRLGHEQTRRDDPRLFHSALHTAGIRDVLCYLLGSPSAWLHHREGPPELPGGWAVGVTIETADPRPSVFKGPLPPTRRPLPSASLPHPRLACCESRSGHMTGDKANFLEEQKTFAVGGSQKPRPCGQKTPRQEDMGRGLWLWAGAGSGTPTTPMAAAASVTHATRRGGDTGPAAHTTVPPGDARLGRRGQAGTAPTEAAAGGLG